METGKMTTWALTAALVVAALGCDADKGGAGAPSASSASLPPPSAPTPSAAPSASASAPPAASSAASKPARDCPEGSTGEGSFNKPCEAKGTARLMDVAWTGKMTDTGPSFRVTNKTKIDIIYGNVAVYFYDKAGKQLEVKDASGKARPSQPCSGKIFDGPMKAGEKAVITFSCVKKEHVPEGAVAIEAEMQGVGFADAAGKTADSYWKNADLAPDVRAKGGVKK